LKTIKTLCLALAAASLLLSGLACAQVYSWKDPDRGQSKLSNIAPPWYSRGEIVSGPRVVETLGGRVVDDTALPYEDRLLLSGKSRDYVEKLRLQKYQEPQARQDPIREPSKTTAGLANRNSADVTSARTETVRKKGS
jgi:hypothetical protein